MLQVPPLRVQSLLSVGLPQMTPGNQAFVQNYRETFGTIPNVFATVSYASVYILAEAIKNAEATDSNSIRDALANIRDLDTVFGKFSFNATGTLFMT